MTRGATIVLAPNRMVQGRILDQPGARIAPLCNRLSVRLRARSHCAAVAIGTWRARCSSSSARSSSVAPFTTLCNADTENLVFGRSPLGHARLRQPIDRARRLRFLAIRRTGAE
jgi:hypothetical protein